MLRLASKVIIPSCPCVIPAFVIVSSTLMSSTCVPLSLPPLCV